MSLKITHFQSLISAELMKTYNRKYNDLLETISTHNPERIGILKCWSYARGGLWKERKKHFIHLLNTDRDID